MCLAILRPQQVSDVCEQHKKIKFIGGFGKKKKFNRLEVYIPCLSSEGVKKWLLIFSGRAKYFCREDNFSF